jgi:hypothetical protein
MSFHNIWIGIRCADVRPNCTTLPTVLRSYLGSLLRNLWNELPSNSISKWVPIVTKKILRKKFCEKKFIFCRYSAGDYIWVANAYRKIFFTLRKNAFAAQIRSPALYRRKINFFSQNFFRKIFFVKIFVGIAPETISESRMHSVKFFLHYGEMHSQLRYSLRRYTNKKYNFFRKIFFAKIFFLFIFVKR